MKMFDRYLARAALKGVALVLLALLILISLAALVGELNQIGKGQYTMVEAVGYVALTIPRRAIELLAVSALVGGIIGLGSLTGNHELMMLRAFGRSHWRLAGSMAYAAIFVMVIGALLMEFVAPNATQEATRRKRVALSSQRAAQTEEDLWIRNEGSIVRIGSIDSEGEMQDLQIFEFGQTRNLQQLIQAERGRVEDDGTWTLLGVRRDDLIASSTSRIDRMSFRGAKNPRNLEILVASPDELSIRALGKRLRRPDPKDDAAMAGRQESEDDLRRWYWRKIGTILLSGMMLLLATPFALGGALPGSISRRLILGIVLGALTHVAVQASAYLSDINDFDPLVAGLAPAAIAATLALVLLLRVK